MATIEELEERIYHLEGGIVLLCSALDKVADLIDQGQNMTPADRFKHDQEGLAAIRKAARDVAQDQYDRAGGKK